MSAMSAPLQPSKGFTGPLRSRSATA